MVFTGCCNMVRTRRLHQTQCQYLLLDDTIDEFSRASASDGESCIRGRAAEGQGVDERKNARTSHTMYVYILFCSLSSRQLHTIVHISCALRKSALAGKFTLAYK